MEEILLNFSQSTGIYAFMSTRWGWPVIESLHFVGLCLLIGSVGLLDLRMLGYARGISMAALHKLVPYGIAGFLLNVVTGIMFFTTAPDQYLYNPAMQMKLLFIAIAGANMMIFNRYFYRQVVMAGAEEDTTAKIKIVAAVSLFCWLAVITAGRLITFYRPPTYWCFWCS